MCRILEGRSNITIIGDNDIDTDDVGEDDDADDYIIIMAALGKPVSHSFLTTNDY